MAEEMKNVNNQEEAGKNRTPGGNTVEITKKGFKGLLGKGKDLAVGLGHKAWDNRGKIAAVAGAAAGAFAMAKLGVKFPGGSQDDGAEDDYDDDDLPENDSSESFEEDEA